MQRTLMTIHNNLRRCMWRSGIDCSRSDLPRRLDYGADRRGDWLVHGSTRWIKMLVYTRTWRSIRAFDRD